MSAFYGEYRKIAAKTAAYQMLESDAGTFFTNRGAGGSVTLTLPNTATIQSGWHCQVEAVAAQNFIVASYASSDNIVYLNDLQADSLAFQTGGEIIGGSIGFVWDGTGWLTNIMVAKGQTITKA